MNFLAHFYLSGDSEDILIGNYLGDFVKGKKYLDYADGISKGIQLHRAIDQYTDNHPIVKHSKKMLWNEMRHYSGVAVDVIYDHFLAKNWYYYSETDLDTFIHEKYATLSEQLHIYSDKEWMVLQQMIGSNWLIKYLQIEGVDKACRGLAKRTKYDSNLEMGAELLIKHYRELETDFLSFFPQIQLFVKEEIERLYDSQ